MAPEAPKPVYDKEPLDPEKHDRAAFSCGVDRLDNYLKRTAKKSQKGDFTRIFVAVNPEASTVVGYYSMNAHGIEGDGLPEALTKRGPRHGVIPAAYLSMIAVDQNAQGVGLGKILLADALKRLIPLADQIGISVVVLDVFDDDGPEAYERRINFYEGMGFKSLSTRRSRMFLTLKDIRAAFAR
jgi:ribosomal protein S18 acetylase RimI-like enzyme